MWITLLTFVFLLCATASKAQECSSLKRGICGQNEDCLWSTHEGACLRKDSLECEHVMSYALCRKLDKTCLWLPRKGKCFHQDNLPCEDILAPPICRKHGNCEWEANACRAKVGILQAKACAKPDCSSIACIQTICEKDEITVTPEGECCPQCVKQNSCGDSDFPVLCAMPQCREGETLVREAGSCCPSCKKACTCEKPDCSLKDCKVTACRPGEDSVPTEGGCCNKCVPKAHCFAPCGNPPICREGQVLLREPGECCPKCQDQPCVEEPLNSGPNCDLIACVHVTCGPGEEQVTSPGECCPKCVASACSNKADCSKVLCPQVLCNVGSIPAKPFGECCETCLPQNDCNGVACQITQCVDGETLITEPGSCCPECKKACPCPKPRGGDCYRETYNPLICGECKYANECKARSAGLDPKVQCTPAPEVDNKGSFVECTNDTDCPSHSDGEICYPVDDTKCDVDCNGTNCPGRCVFPQNKCGFFPGSSCPPDHQCVDLKGDGCTLNCEHPIADCPGVCIPSAIFTMGVKES